MTDLSKDNDAGGKLYSAPALEKGLDIIELLCASEAPMSQKDIAQRLGRSVGEIYRMLACLVSRNYASLNEENYTITTKLFELAHANPPTHRLLLEAVPIMQKLAGQLDQSCHLTVYGRGSQIVVAKVDSPGGMGFSVRVGAELDLLPSISGRVLLAFQDEEIRAFRIAEALQRKPEHADPQIAGVLDFIRARGFEAAPSVQVRGLYAISFPVLASQGRAIAALTVPYAERIDQSQRKSISEVQDVLRDAAALLTSRVAGQLKQSAPRLEATKTKRRAR